MIDSVIVDKWQINWYDILWMHVCVVLAIIVCWCRSSASRSSRTLLCFFLHAWFVVIVFLCVLVCGFFLALRDVCVTHERLVLVDTEHAHTILHLSFTGWGTFWYQVCYTTSDFTIVSQDWNLIWSNTFVVYRLTEPTSGASTPDLDPFSPVDRKRALKGCTFVPDIQEIRVRSESTSQCVPSWKAAYSEKTLIHFVLSSFCVYF